MNKVKLILGPPGTGKTTTLLNLIDGYLSKDIDPEKIGFISFTKKSVNEARDRAALRFLKKPEWFTYFRTIHALSFRMLGMSRSEVMQRNHYQELGDLMGLKITGIHRQDQMVYEMSKGDQMVFVESLSRLLCESIDETWEKLNGDMDIFTLRYFQESIIKFKKANLLYDFTDMLVKYLEEGHKPKLDVLFVDEAQDLCPLQWRIVESLMEKSDNVYIAGDDDQAIFRWSGADVDYFLDLANKYETEVLTQSYRLPKTIYSFSSKLVAKIVKRNTKEFKPKKELGKVEWIGRLEDVNMDKGQWLILVRNGYIIRDIVDYLRMCGYPYETTYYSIQEDKPLKAAFILERLKAGAKLKVPEIQKPLSYISTGRQGSRKLTKYIKDDVYNMEELIKTGFVNAEIGSLIWHKALNKISPEDREYYIAVRRREETLTDTPRIKVSTIHGAKGGEATNVVLFTDMSNKTYRYMEENYDDEVRVFYVGATRAKENLYIVEPQTPTFFTF